MKNKPFILLVALWLCFVTAIQSQVIIKNGFGIHAGITQFDILTDNFETTSSTGFTGGFVATADIPHKWYNVSFGLQFFNNNIEIEGARLVGGDALLVENLDYRIQGVQGTFLFHVKLAGSFFTFDIGPQLQFNGELELQDDNGEPSVILNNGFPRAEDISDISRFNANGVVGLSGGVGQLRLRIHYTYGFTNILNRLNDEQGLNDLDGQPSRFEGNQSIITASLMFTF